MLWLKLWESKESQELKERRERRERHAEEVRELLAELYAFQAKLESRSASLEELQADIDFLNGLTTKPTTLDKHSK